MVMTMTILPVAEVRNAYVRARTSMRPSWMRVW
jgi:hypothetical protein